MLFYWCLINTVLLFATTNGKPWDAQSSADPNWWIAYNAHRTQTQVHAKNTRVVFYGDSLTFAWYTTGQSIWNAMYAARGALNYGIAGDCTQQVLWRLRNGELDGLQQQPKLFVLMIGTNNLAGSSVCQAASADETAVGIQTIVQEVRRRLPQTKILLLGILPRAQGLYADSIARVNLDLMNLVDNNWIHYMNMISQFQISHTQQKLELYDPTDPSHTHLNLAGYQVWYQTMEPLFNQLIN
ncbi:unnamed protein product [Adineta ricciae]|uniref:SGNH hydrolase-type esterase domain-containing protein n=1 Tax=Adineta ricciae TaxID=249248 RepID=A0A815MK22_ADIRI|nr:unnamed protein product [Adineta ricciae]CAF1566001.1 unnamed protein product [Adineta ricciae]